MAVAQFYCLTSHIKISRREPSENATSSQQIRVREAHGTQVVRMRQQSGCPTDVKIVVGPTKWLEFAEEDDSGGASQRDTWLTGRRKKRCETNWIAWSPGGGFDVNHVFIGAGAGISRSFRRGLSPESGTPSA